MMKGVVTLVTGGASGLGRATVERVVRQGGMAVICDLPTSQGASLAKTFEPNAVFCPVDVTSESDVQKSLQVVKDKFGRLDAVVNCAGKQAMHKVYDFKQNTTHPLDLFNKLFETNVIGTFNVVRLAVGLIAENELNDEGSRGIIINVSSTVAFESTAETAAYTATKGAVAAMTLPLAREFAPHGIRVCSIAPGFFETPMLAFANKKMIAAYLKKTPYPKRLGKPDEFASIVQTLITTQFINGEVIRMDGALRI